MKSRVPLMIGSVVLALVVALTVGCAATSKPTAEKPITLKWASYLPPAHFLSVFMKEAIAEIEQQTGGRLKIDFLPAEALGKAAEAWELAMTGVADISYYSPAYHADIFPLTLIMEMPFAVTSAKQGKEVFDELYKREEAIRKEFSGNYYPGYLFICGQNEIFSKKELTKVDDFKGLKMMSLGVGRADLIKAIGAVPVEITFPESYQALQRGVIDATTTSWLGSTQWKWEEVIKYAVGVGFSGGWVAGNAINWDTWKSLPKDIQKVINDVSAKYGYTSTVEYDIKAKSAQEFHTSKGVKVSEFPAAERAKLSAMAAPLWQKWVDDNEAKGRPAKKVYQTFCEILKERGEEVPVKLPGLYK